MEGMTTTSLLKTSKLDLIDPLQSLLRQGLWVEVNIKVRVLGLSVEGVESTHFDMQIASTI